MKYTQKIVLKNGTEALIRNSDAPDGANVYEAFNLTHAESDYLLSYPDENSYDPEQEAQFLAKKAESPNEIELVAIMDGKIAGMAGIEAVGSKYKVKHRAEFGISVLKEYWGLGLGKALMQACIQCAREAGYVQLELNVVAENERAALEAQALRNGDTEEFFELVNASGASSAQLLQNLYSPKSPFSQPIPLALAVSRRFLGGSGAVRVHGGGFAGTIQAFVPVYTAKDYIREMERIFGAGCCSMLNIRPCGGIRIC